MDPRQYGNTYDRPRGVNGAIKQPDGISPAQSRKPVQRGPALDSDRLLIILLIFLLAKNGADMPLILALAYLLT